MKVCVTAQDQHLDAEVDPRFGRCQYFLFIDTDSMEFEAVRNENANGFGGVGVQSAQFVANKNVKTVLTGNVGPNAFRALKAAQITVITGMAGSVKDAVEKFKSGACRPATEPNVDTKFGTPGA